MGNLFFLTKMLICSYCCMKPIIMYRRIQISKLSVRKVVTIFLSTNIRVHFGCSMESSFEDPATRCHTLTAFETVRKPLTSGPPSPATIECWRSFGN